MSYTDRLLTFRSLLLAARPGMGKTTLALCLADAFRARDGREVSVFMPTVPHGAPWAGGKTRVTPLPEPTPARIDEQLTERTGLIILDHYDPPPAAEPTAQVWLSALAHRGISVIVTAWIPRVPLECRRDKHPRPADLGWEERSLAHFDAVACLYTDAYYAARTGAPERGEIRLYPRGNAVPEHLALCCDFPRSLMTDA